MTWAPSTQIQFGARSPYQVTTIFGGSTSTPRKGCGSRPLFTTQCATRPVRWWPDALGSCLGQELIFGSDSRPGERPPRSSVCRGLGGRFADYADLWRALRAGATLWATFSENR